MVLKGASIQKYYWTTEMSQGRVEFLNVEEYAKRYNNSDKAKHHKYDRIAIQGMTGANDKVRIVASIVPKGIYLANSCNYILPIEDFEIKALLALINSKLINWYFRCFSTNSNVNGYEVDNLPLLRANEKYQKLLGKLIDDIDKQLKNNEDIKALENEIDNIVYHLYGLTYDEVLVVDPATPISREEYLAYKETNAKC